MRNRTKLINDTEMPVMANLGLTFMEKTEEYVREYSKANNKTYKSLSSAMNSGVSQKILVPIVRKALDDSIIAAIATDISDCKEERKPIEEEMKHILKQYLPEIGYKAHGPRVLLKLCSKCNLLKPLCMYDINAFDGVDSQCSDCISIANRSQTDKNTERQREWRDKNRPHIRNYMNEYHKKRRKEDPCFKMDSYFRSQFRNALKTKEKHTKEIVEKTLGYTIKEFVSHIENQWEPGMDWSNHSLTGWHIDHKIPVSSLPYDSTEHPNFQKCWALENLQPLWAQDNFTKSNKIL